MQTITLRRTFNIGDYESLSVETTAQHEDISVARLIATKQILEQAQQEMVRIFNIRVNNTLNSPWEQVLMELKGVRTELGEKHGIPST